MTMLKDTTAVKINELKRKLALVSFRFEDFDPDVIKRANTMYTVLVKGEICYDEQTEVIRALTQRHKEASGVQSD